jgi:hypothetical protein
MVALASFPAQAIPVFGLNVPRPLTLTDDLPSGDVQARVKRVVQYLANSARVELFGLRVAVASVRGGQASVGAEFPHDCVHREALKRKVPDQPVDLLPHRVEHESLGDGGSVCGPLDPVAVWRPAAWLSSHRLGAAAAFNVRGQVFGVLGGHPACEAPQDLVRGEFVVFDRPHGDALGS